MKKYLLLLLSVAAMVSCKKEKNETKPSEVTTVTIRKNGSDTDRVTLGSGVSPTYSVAIATFDIVVQGSVPITLNRLPVDLNVFNAEGSTNANAVITALYLYNSAGVQIDSEIIPTGINPTVSFKDLALILPVGTTTLTIKADIARIDGGVVANGATAQINITPADISDIQLLNVNNTTVNNVPVTGSITGSMNVFYQSFIGVGGSGLTTNNLFTMVVPFNVAAFGRDVYIPSKCEMVTSGFVFVPNTTADQSIQFAVDNGSILEPSGAQAQIVYTGSDNLTPDKNGNYKIPKGQYKLFELVITFTPTIAGSYRGELVNVNYNTSDSGTEYLSYTNGLNAQLFYTSYVTGQ